MISNIAPPAHKTPTNILDNSNFRHPINQRGVAGGSISNSSSYFIDRWMTYQSALDNLTYTFAPGGLQIAVSTGSGGIGQRLELALETGKSYTLAAQVDGVVYALQITGGTSCNQNEAGTTTLAYVTDYGGCNTVRVYFTGVTTRTITWAALYEGAYAADALPAYTPKPYSAEIAECRRYYQRYNYLQYETIGMSYEGPAYCCVQISVLGQMRVKYPTLTISAPLAVGSQHRTPNTANVTSGNAILGLNYSMIAGYAGAAYSYTSNAAGVTIELSADL